MEYTQSKYNPAPQQQSVVLDQGEVLDIFTGAIADAGSDVVPTPGDTPIITLFRGDETRRKKNITLALVEGNVEHRWVFPLDEAEELVRHRLLGARAINATETFELRKAGQIIDEEEYLLPKISKPVVITDGLVVTWRDQ